MRCRQIFQRPVIRPLHFCREKAGRGLALLPMIMKTFAATALAGTGFIGTVAHFHVVGAFGTIHIFLLNNIGIQSFYLSGIRNPAHSHALGRD